MAIQDESSELMPEKVAAPVEDIAKPDEPSIEIENRNPEANTNSIATRKALLLMMLIAVILIAVGAITVSLFATQHDWSTGRACLECHSDVGDEFTNMAALQPHKAMTCPDCHQDISLGFDDEHSANLPQCISCHPTVETNITFDTEAHKEMYTEAGTYGFNEGGNEACIVCHTGLDIDAVFERPDYYNFTIDQTYSITNVETSSTVHTNTYSYTKIGRLHTYYDGPNVNCSTDGCHQDVDAARGGGVSGGHQTTTQPLNVTHIMSSPCTTCHKDSLEVPDTDYHAAKNITCAYRLNGCHDRGDTLVSANMTTMFAQIDAAVGMTYQKEGDICWGCHSGYNWLDPVGLGGGVHTFVNYTTDQDNLDHGTITGGTEANTHGAGTEDIQEVDIGGTTIFANYTVASDIGEEGTVSGTAGPPYWQNIIEGEPPVGDIESIQEVAVAAGTVWTTVFNEPWLAAYASWPGSATQPAPAQEYWVIVTADANDFNIGDFGNPATQLSLQMRDADAGSGQYAEARDAAGAYFNPAGSSWTDGYVNYSLSATLDNGQSAYFDVWQGGAWVNVPALTVGPAPGNGWNSPWTTYSYQLVALDLAGNQFAWRYWNDGTGNDDIVQFDDITLEVETSSGASASLEHKWTTDSIPAGYTALNLYVRGLSSDTADDVFSVFWSNDDISYLDTGINIDQAAMTTYAPFTFPLGESGILYIQIIDDNTGDVALTTCEIDTIRIQHESLAASEFSLEHRWRTQNLPPGADDLTLIVDARYAVAASDDDFQIGYSTAIDGPYTPVITVNSDVMTTYSAGIPVMSGQIYLNVVDTNNADAVQQDTVIIDDIRIMWHEFAPAAGSGLKIQVWTEPDFTVNVWNDTTSAFEQVYPRAVTNCADCHDDTGTNPVPFGSGKYINHLNKTVSNYDYTKCGSCHDLVSEPWYPHDVPHNVVIDWTAYASAGDTNVDNDFCDVICHYSNFDSRVSPVDYRDASTTWMKDIFTSFTNDGVKHTFSNLIDADGTVECVDCHLNHEQLPDDSDDAVTEFQLYGGGSVQGCGDQDLGVGGCHLVNNNTADATDARETPLSHGNSVPWNSVGRDDCTEANCHDKHNYPLDPTEGHNPSPGACHPSGILCGADSYQHNKHIVADWGIPDYDYNCSQCHFNAAGDLDGWYDTTYGTGEHNDGILQVRFNTTAPATVGIATYANALAPTYNATSNSLCADTYCHSDGYAAGFSWSVTPDWLSDNVACGDCHDTPPTTSSHPVHTDETPYDFNCSECHFVSGNSAAGWFDITYGSIQHVDGQIQVAFNSTVNGMALHFGDTANYPGTWDGTDTCSDIYCHDPSDGADGNAVDTSPVWDNPATTFCGGGSGGSCHGDNTDTNKPTTNNHPEHAQTEAYRCGECHWDSVAGAPSTDGTYGTASHVDGDFDMAWWDNAGAGFPPGLLTNVEWGWTQVVYTSGNPCDVYCHDAVTDDDATITTWTPSWGDATAAACDLCHGGEWANAIPIDTGSHSGHIDPGKANMICSDCHIQTGTFLPGDNLFSHLNGTVDFSSAGDLVSYDTTANSYPDVTGTLKEGDDTYGTCDVNEGNCHPDDREWGGACHPGGDCGANSYQHVTHMGDSWGIPQYDYNCSQCHFNAAGDLDGWYDTTYGTIEHDDGTLQVRFNTTAPETVGIATYANALAPTYNATLNSLCANTYCHSDGNATASPGSFTWKVTPDWLSDNVGCGDCHDIPMTSYAHRNHTANNMPNTNPWYDFNCSECHYSAGTLAAGWYDTTYGSIQHVDGQVQVAFNTTVGDSIATFNGVLPAGIYNGDGTCDNIYCHSNGYDIGGAGDIFYTTPAWKSLTSIACGDCHGVPNLVSNELNTNTHLKHTRNFGGIFASRDLFWVDATGDPADTTPPYGWPDSIYDAGEAIIQDLNNNRMLDPGILNGVSSPDNVYTSGNADLSDFNAASNTVKYYDTNSNTNWDLGEDIYWEVGGGGARPTRYDAGNDYLLYIGAAQEVADADPTVALAADDTVMYLDSDHDDVYDAWLDGLGGSWGDTFSGTEEPLIYVGSNLAPGSPLQNTHEVLAPYDILRFWYTDFNRWYDFDCSECHYDNPPTAGYGTYGTSLHVNAVKDVIFDTTAQGIASGGGTFAVQASDAGAWTPGTQECYGIYCHSDGYLRDAIDGTGNGLPDWSGDGIFDDAAAAYNRKLVEPVWTDTTRTTVNCDSCHYGADKPSDVATGTNYPFTGAHRKTTQHTGQSQFTWHSGDAAPCLECHYRYDTYNTNGPGENQWWSPYGSYEHVDGSVWMGPDGFGQHGPLSAGNGYDGCHNGIAAWRTGYENSC